MKGYPKNLNTKEDYEYVRENFPSSEWKKDWQNLLDTMEDWVPTGELKSKDDGKTDSTHKVIESETTGADGEKTTVYTQCELQTIPTCKLLRLGFTKQYVQSVVKSL